MSIVTRYLFDPGLTVPLIAYAMIGVLCAWKPVIGGFRWIAKIGGRLSRDAGRSVLAVMVASFAFSACVSLLVRMPAPTVHDEFSYLLAADTFAHGRLTNPPHPMWRHFETFHIIQQPTYQSKFPPAQGILLAVGQVLTGHAIVGAWIGTALACGAICWMLQAWIGPRGALLGGLLAGVHPAILGWGQSYWGGTVALIGSALLLGGFRRVAGKPARAVDGAMLSLGVVILACGRPYEGLVLCIPLAIAMLVWILRNQLPWRPIIAAACVVVVGGAWLMYYNWRVTDHPLRLPYQQYESAYGIAPLFPWQSPWPEREFRHPIMDRFQHGWALGYYTHQHTLDGFLTELPAKLRVARNGFFRWFVPTIHGTERDSPLAFPLTLFQYGLALPLVALPWVILRSRWMLCGLLLTLWTIAGVLIETYSQAHYYAVAMPLVLMLVVQSLRHLRATLRWRNWHVGAWFARVFVAFCLIATVYSVNNLHRIDREPWRMTVLSRENVAQTLRERGGKHLVIVAYEQDHDPLAEWVYNGHDLDSADILWARDMGRDANTPLFEYFRDTRSIWTVFPADPSQQLRPVSRE
jgi:hypothetical protein